MRVLCGIDLKTTSWSERHADVYVLLEWCRFRSQYGESI